MTDMPRYRWTSFGPMLDEDGPFVLLADAEVAIDEARSQEAKVHAATERWSPLSHLQGQRDALAAAVQRVEALADDPNSGVDWNWDYDIDPTGNTRNPLVWIREAVAAIRDAEGGA